MEITRKNNIEKAELLVKRIHHFDKKINMQWKALDTLLKKRGKVSKELSRLVNF